MMKRGKKTFRMLGAMALAVAVTFAASGMTADAATAKMDLKTATEFGFSFTGTPGKDDSWHIDKWFSVDFSGDGNVVHYCKMTIGFEDEIMTNYDSVKIPQDNGVASGMEVYGTVVNGNGDMKNTSRTTSNKASGQAMVEHTGDSVKYAVTFIHP